MAVLVAVFVPSRLDGCSGAVVNSLASTLFSLNSIDPKPKHFEQNELVTTLHNLLA
jgi:hypothetical protein